MKAFLAALPSLPNLGSTNSSPPLQSGPPCLTRRVSICRRVSGEHVLIAVVPRESCNALHAADASYDVKAAEISPTGKLLHLTIDVGPLRENTQTALMTAALIKAGPFKHVTQYPCMFGHIVLDKLYVLVATKIERAAMLPFSRSVYNVKGTAWVGIPLDGVPPPRVSKKDQSRLDHFLSVSFDEGYYFSDEANMSTLFPYDSRTSITVHDPSLCDWSIYLRKPYVECDCSGMCSVLIRGFVKSVPLTAAYNGVVNESFVSASSAQRNPHGASRLPPSVDLNVMMVGRQNRLNPGPRYFGRGLNENGQAGNDHVYEIVMWHYKDPPLNIRVAYARHVYLRGTVPLHFKSKLSTSGIGEANILIGADVYEGSADYLVRQVNLLKEFHRGTAQDGPLRSPFLSPTVSPPPEGSPTTTRVHLRCVNLLKAVSSAGEDLLTHHFRVAVMQASTKLSDARSESTPAANASAVDFTTMDWLGVQKDFGTPKAAEDLWATTLAYLDPSPVTCGEIVGPSSMAPRPTAELFGSPAMPTGAQAGGDASLYSGDVSAAGPSESPTEIPPTRPRTQRRFMRVNCADSLDRTNVACFFILCQVATKLVTALDLNLKSIQAVAKSTQQSPSSTGHTAATAESGGQLSPRRCNSSAQLVVSSPTPAEAPADDFDMMNTVAVLHQVQPESEAIPDAYFKSYTDLVAGLPVGLMQSLVELFVANGDCVAQLFTSTGALHTSVMRKLVPGMKEAPNNGIISAQRRYENMFRDKKKRRVLETILGVRLPVHFPSFQGLFGILPLPNELWATAISILGIPANKNVTPETVSVAIQAHWLDIQEREGLEFATRTLREIPIRLGVDPSTFVASESQALPTPHVEGTSDAPGSPRGASGTSSSNLSASPTTGGGTEPDDVVIEGAEVDTAEHPALDRLALMAVAVLPTPNICRELLMRGALPITFGDGSVGFASLHPYTYAVENHTDANEASAGSGPVDAVANFATSIKSRMKRLMN